MPLLGDRLSGKRRVREAKRSVAEAADRQVAAANEQRAVTRALVEAGLNGSEVAVVLGVGKQRASQLVRAK